MRKFINQLGNLFMKPLLRSPLHFFASGSLMLVTFTGRKTGTVYTTPVQYLRQGKRLTFFTQQERTWWKNLKANAPLILRVRGQNIPGMATYFVTDIEAITKKLRQMYPNMAEERAKQTAATTVMIHIQLD